MNGKWKKCNVCDKSIFIKPEQYSCGQYLCGEHYLWWELTQIDNNMDADFK